MPHYFIVYRCGDEKLEQNDLKVFMERLTQSMTIFPGLLLTLYGGTPEALKREFLLAIGPRYTDCLVAPATSRYAAKIEDSWDRATGSSTLLAALLRDYNSAP